MAHRVRGIIVVAAALLLSAPAQAQFDHLQCWKVKPSSKTKGLVDLTPLQAQLPPGKGCKLVGPKLFCAPVLKEIVEVAPPPIGAPAGPDAGDFLCYKAKCKIPPVTLLASDQFNSYQLTLKKSFLLCAPARKDTATTSTTVETTSTTVETTSTTIITTSTTLPCGVVDTPSGEVCDGDCPPGLVCLNNVSPTAPPGVVDCTCVDPNLDCFQADTCTQGLCRGVDERCVNGETGCECFTVQP
jgi:hypothetical protein